MTGLRISACFAASTLAGINKTSEAIHEMNDSACASVMQSSVYGNRIAHNPLTPKVFVPPKDQSRPTSINELIQWFHGSYLAPDDYKTLSKHIDEDGRQIRSEAREMISIGCAVLTYYYDVISGEIAFRTEKGRLARISYKTIAKRAGVSLIRVKRFFRFLKEKNLIKIITDRKKDANGVWRSNISRKFLNPSFFIETLGIKAWKKITSLREWILKKAKPKHKKQRENVSMITSLFKSVSNIPSTLKKKITKSTSNCKQYNDPEKERSLIRHAQRLHELDPSRSLGEYLTEIKANSS